MDFSIQMIFGEGKCKAALDFYASVFDSKIEQMQQFKDMPELPDACDPELILFATLDIAGKKVMFCDTIDDTKFVKGNSVRMCITSQDKRVIENIYNKLAQDGTVVMPIAKTFFSDAFGMVDDKFGNQWQLCCE